MRSGRARLDHTVVQGFYDRMRAVAPAAYGAMERDRAGDRGRAFRDTACGRLAASLDAAGLRALGMWAHHWCMRFYDDDTRVGLRLVREIAGRSGLGWTVDEVRWMLGESTAAGPSAAYRFTLPAAAVRELPQPARGEFTTHELSGATGRELPTGERPEAGRGVAGSERAGERGRVSRSGAWLRARGLRAESSEPRECEVGHNAGVTEPSNPYRP